MPGARRVRALPARPTAGSRLSTSLGAVLACAVVLALGAPAAAQAPSLPLLPGKPLLSPPPAPAPAPGPAAVPAPARAFTGDAMWIWLLSRSNRGNVNAIATRARRHGLELVIMKGADGGTRYRQLSPAFVRAMHARGLRVCAYQFVYGRRPYTEARVGARLAGTGIDCLVVDAETAYEGRYVAAQTYVRKLRARLRPGFPVGLTSFPYVHYHPAFPYSVFLGPGGAQFNVPQMYWRAIGTSVNRVFPVTYRHNRVYGRPIFPLGQIYEHPPASQIRRFRALAAARGAAGISWWSWQSGSARSFRAVAAPFAPLAPPPDDGWPTLGRRSRGYLVVWAQQHLLSAGKPLRVTGTMTSATRAAVSAFQAERGLAPTGSVDARTWPALLAHGPAPVKWRRRGYALAATPGDGRPEPLSARLPARRNELRGRPGR